MSAPSLPAVVGQLAPYLPRPTLVDRMVGYFSPSTAVQRLRARTLLNLFGRGGYVGARRDDRSLQEWNPGLGSADADTLPDLMTLRARARDLSRNAPIATGAVNTQVMNVIGPGLRLQPRIDREALGLTDETADAWERRAERLWNAWAGTVACDLTRRTTFAGLQALVFRSQLDSGDVAVLRRDVPSRGDPFSLRLQLLEADRICNPQYGPDTDRLTGGVELDDNGAPIRFYVTDRHPGEWLRPGAVRWIPVDVYGAASGDRQLLHIAALLRPGQTRGVPYLAPVIKPLKELDRYSHAELAAAVISAFFTIFIEQPAPVDAEQPLGLAPVTNPSTGAAEPHLPGQYKMGPAAILDLAPGEKVTTANPGRPNDKFDPFVVAILRQVGVALELPFELLIKHFTASYSAARAALNEAWRAFLTRRTFVASHFCQPVYGWWLGEAIARGYLNAPGFFADPLIRQAWSQADWIGPVRGQIDELKEVNAAAARVKAGFSTEARETAALTGGDWESDHRQRVKEQRARERDGLIAAAPAAPSPAEPPAQADPDDDDETERRAA